MKVYDPVITSEVNPLHGLDWLKRIISAIRSSPLAPPSRQTAGACLTWRIPTGAPRPWSLKGAPTPKLSPSWAHFVPAMKKTALKTRRINEDCLQVQFYVFRVFFVFLVNSARWRCYDRQSSLRLETALKEEKKAAKA